MPLVVYTVNKYTDRFKKVQSINFYKNVIHYSYKRWVVLGEYEYEFEFISYLHP